MEREMEILQLLQYFLCIYADGGITLFGYFISLSY